MARGKYSAWPHVVIGFLLLAFLFAAFVVLPGAFVLEPPGRPPYFSDRSQRDTAGAILLIAGACLGIALSWLVFRDRWKCVEAFTSRYCSGIANVSLLYAPLIAAGYALARAGRKLGGSERPDHHGALPSEFAVGTQDLAGAIAGGFQQGAERLRAAVNPSAPLEPQRPTTSAGLVAFIALVVVVAMGAFAVLLVKRLWIAKPDALAKPKTICPDGGKYCHLPLPLVPKGDVREAGLALRLEPAEVDVAPGRQHVVVKGTFTHEDKSELEILQLGLRLFDAGGAEIAVIPLKAYQHFMPPLRSGDSAPWYERAEVSAIPRRGELFVLERRVVPAPAAPDDGTDIALELPPSTPRHFKLSAVARVRERRQLSIETSGKLVVAIRNDGEGVVRELELAVVPRGGVGRDLKRSSPQHVAYAHMPPMYPGERRVVAFSYYVVGQVAEERLVVTDIN